MVGWRLGGPGLVLEFDRILGLAFQRVSSYGHRCGQRQMGQHDSMPAWLLLHL